MAQPHLPIPELHVVGVADAGVPNSERVVLRPTQPLSLLGYGVAVGISARTSTPSAHPLHDSCFWFPAIEVAPPSWILIFTGKGEFKESEWEGQAVHTFHWGRQYTVFTHELIVPVLFRLDGATVGGLLSTPLTTG